MFSHNIAEVIHQSAEPEGGYTPSSPVKVIYLDGKEAYSQWGSDVGGGGVLAWRHEHGDDAATAYVAPPVSPEQVVTERKRRLELGFDFDFGDKQRGVHHIGTTDADLAGWDEVSKAAQAAINLGAPDTTFTIVTDTGPAEITAMEWQMILAAAAAHRQPIWAASFALQAMDLIPADYANDKYWPS